MVFDRDGFPPPSRPIPVEGGIRVRSRRGAIGETWWSKRFITVLESLGIGGRLTRGRSYARSGQVLDLEVAAGSLSATVQGSDPDPYETRVGIGVIRPEQWEHVERRLADQALYSAKLLAGEMPHDIDEVFAAERLALFPDDAGELEMDCSCPDGAVPCKHLAATLYVFAEALDDDPFRLLAWRGREKERVLERLRELRGGEAAPDTTERDLTDVRGLLAETGGAASTDSSENFWNSPTTGREDDRHERDPGGERVPGDGVLRQLDQPGIQVRGHNLHDLLRPAYERMTRCRE